MTEYDNVVRNTWDARDLSEVRLDVSKVDRLYILTVQFLIDSFICKYGITARMRCVFGEDEKDEKEVIIYIHAVRYKVFDSIPNNYNNENNYYLEDEGEGFRYTDGLIFPTEYTDFILAILGSGWIIDTGRINFLTECFTLDGGGGIYNNNHNDNNYYNGYNFGRFSTPSLKRLCCGAIYNSHLEIPGGDDSTVPKTLLEDLETFERREDAKKLAVYRYERKIRFIRLLMLDEDEKVLEKLEDEEELEKLESEGVSEGSSPSLLYPE